MVNLGFEMSKRAAQADHKAPTGNSSERLSRSAQNNEPYVDESLDVSDSSVKDDSISADRRKMQRRAANRRSAQLSRARKKVSDVQA